MMIDVYLNADGQRLSVRKRPETIVAGSSGVVRLRFTFSPEWDGFRACAMFGNEAVSIVNGSCMVPDSATSGKHIEVSVLGDRDGARMATDVARIRQKTR